MHKQSMSLVMCDPMTTACVRLPKPHRTTHSSHSEPHPTPHCGTRHTPAPPAEGSSDTLWLAESPAEMRSPIETLRVRPLGARMDCPSSSNSSPASIRGLAVSGSPVGCSARGESCRQRHVTAWMVIYTRSSGRETREKAAETVAADRQLTWYTAMLLLQGSASCMSCSMLSTHNRRETEETTHNVTLCTHAISVSTPSPG